MEARIFTAVALLTAAVLFQPTISFGSSARSANFIVEAPTPELADKIAKAAEQYRHDLAIEWIGQALPNWFRPCPIVAQVAPNLGAGGATSFVFDKIQGRDEVFGWDMKIQGSEERILDSVLPHEVTHTIFASYFRRPLPRWADEGACTTVEHSSERNKQQVMLVTFLRTNRGIAFDKLFAMKDYPPEVLPLYSEGYSLARFLIDQWGRKKFLEFVGEGMESENWPATLRKEYGFQNLQSLQDSWLDWVKQGSPTLLRGTPTKRGWPIATAEPVRSRFIALKATIVRARPAADRMAERWSPPVHSARRIPAGRQRRERAAHHRRRERTPIETAHESR